MQQLICLVVSLGAIAWIRAGTIVRPRSTLAYRWSIECAFGLLIALLLLGA
jgi:hypothetical protein